MAAADKRRPSGDGDQFHYHRAARRCPMLLAADEPLAAVPIEGASTEESPSHDAGIGSIDMAEYASSANPTIADRVDYGQLKHWTRHSDEKWTPSELSKTLNDFAARYTQLVSTFGNEDVARRFSFEFTTNRPAPLRYANSAPESGRGVGEAGHCRHGVYMIILLRRAAAWTDCSA